MSKVNIKVLHPDLLFTESKFQTVLEFLQACRIHLPTKESIQLLPSLRSFYVELKIYLTETSEATQILSSEIMQNAHNPLQS